MKNHKSSTGALAALMCACVLWTAPAAAHCEIPCGIYGDRMRVDMLEEHFRTVEKSMRKIRELQPAAEDNANQLVRWVMNKENHCNEIQTIVYQYFMNQRIKPVAADAGGAYEKYVAEITLLHRMLVQAMKCKQTTAREHVEQLRSLLSDFAESYFGEGVGKGHGHQHE